MAWAETIQSETNWFRCSKWQFLLLYFQSLSWYKNNKLVQRKKTVFPTDKKDWGTQRCPHREYTHFGTKNTYIVPYGRGNWQTAKTFSYADAVEAYFVIVKPICIMILQLLSSLFSVFVYTYLSAFTCVRNCSSTESRRVDSLRNSIAAQRVTSAMEHETRQAYVMFVVAWHIAISGRWKPYSVIYLLRYNDEIRWTLST